MAAEVGDQPPSGRARLPSAVRILLGASFVSDIGSGLTLPLLLIYLHEVRHIGLGVSGLLIGGATMLALPVGPWTGTLVDKLGPKRVAIAALGVQGVGTAALTLVHSPLSAILPMLLFGVGAGGSWPAWNALLATVVTEEARPRVFALTFQLLNIGLGLGALVTGAVVHVNHAASFEVVYVADGATTLLLAAVLGALPSRLLSIPRPMRRAVPQATAQALPQARPQATAQATAQALPQARDSLEEAAVESEAGERDDVEAIPEGYRRVLSDRRFRRYLAAMLLLTIAGYGAMSTGMVGFATAVVGVTPRTIAWAFAANTAVISLLQPIGLRLAKRMRRTVALSVVALIWAASWGVLDLADVFPRSGAGDGLVIAMFAVFALGEIILSPVAAPLVNDLSPPELRGRYNALSSTVFSLASVISPAVSGVLLGVGLGRLMVALLAACCIVAVASFAHLRQALTPREDHDPELSGSMAGSEDQTAS